MAKTVKDSCTEQVRILALGNMNGHDRLFGGQLMARIDVVAAVVARSHSGYYVTTAAIDSLEFWGRDHTGYTVLQTGKLTRTGRTSMEVCVKTYVEALAENRHGPCPADQGDFFGALPLQNIFSEGGQDERPA